MKQRRFTIGPLCLHRQQQWDLDCWPWVCGHWRYDGGNGSRRVFCLWGRGVQLGRWRWVWKKTQ